MKFIFTLFATFIFFSSVSAQLKISEIMYNPPESGDDSLEYIEIYNTTDLPYSLSGHFFSAGIVDSFSADDVIPPNGYFITAKKASAMQTVFGITPHQWRSGALSNSGELLSISKIGGPVVFSMTYGDAGTGWEPLADGEGYSMELCDLNAEPNNKLNWSKSLTSSGKSINGKEVFGTPGKANTAICLPSYNDTVFVTNFTFTPQIITIKEGESVLWIFKDGQHNVNGQKSVYPSNSDDFYSGVPKSAPYEYSYVFTKAGTNDYRCDLHFAMGMTGQVIVLPLHPTKVYPPRSIEDARRTDATGLPQLKDSLAELHGVVYGINMRASGISLTMIDESDYGINVFQAAQNFGYTVQEGDGIVVRGTIDHFNGLAQINIDTLWKVSSGNSLVQPLVTTTLSENTESYLTKLENVHLKDPSEWKPGTTFNATVTDDINDYSIRVINLTTLSNEPAPVGNFNITGLGSQFDSSSPYTDGYQLVPRYKEDLELTGASKASVLNSGINLYPNPVSNELSISSIYEFSKVTIQNINGLTLHSYQSVTKIDVSRLPVGMYILKLQTKEGVATKAFVKM